MDDRDSPWIKSLIHEGNLAYRKYPKKNNSEIQRAFYQIQDHVWLD